MRILRDGFRKRFLDLSQDIYPLKRRQVALSIMGNTLRLLNTQGTHVILWTEIPFNPLFMAGGSVGDKQGLANVIRNALASKGITSRRVVASFPGFHSVVRIIKLPRIKDIRPEQVLPREARRLMTFSENEQYLFWQLAGEDRDSRNFVAIAVPRAYLQAFVDTLELAGLSIVRLELAPLCLIKGLREARGVIAHLESDSIDIVVVENSLPNLVRSLWMGDNPIFAESAPSRLAEELDNTIVFYNSTNPDNPIPEGLPIHLAGGLVTADMSPAISAVIGRPVIPLLPPIETQDDFPWASMAVNAGLIVGS